MLRDSIPFNMNLQNSGPLSISNSGSKLGFIAIGYGTKNVVGVYLSPTGANAGKDINAVPGETVILNGSKSASPKPGSQILRYSWKSIPPSANGTILLPCMIPINKWPTSRSQCTK